MPEFYTILAWKISQNTRIFITLSKKINKIPEFYMIFARKMSEFYIIIARIKVVRQHVSTWLKRKIAQMITGINRCDNCFNSHDGTGSRREVAVLQAEVDRVFRISEWVSRLEELSGEHGWVFRTGGEFMAVESRIWRTLRYTRVCVDCYDGTVADQYKVNFGVVYTCRVDADSRNGGARLL